MITGAKPLWAMPHVMQRWSRSEALTVSATALNSRLRRGKDLKATIELEAAGVIFILREMYSLPEAYLPSVSELCQAVKT